MTHPHPMVRTRDTECAPTPLLIMRMCGIAGIAVATLLSVAPTAHAAGTPCHTIQTVTQAAASPHGSPFDYFVTRPSLMLTVACDQAGVTIDMSGTNPDTFIYEYGFHRVNGKWQRITFVGAQKNGPWVVQRASARIDNPVTDREGKIIAYVCQKVAGAWKCGCRDNYCAQPFWQMQTYRYTPGAVGVGQTTLPSISSPQTGGLTGGLTSGLGLTTDASAGPGVQRLSNYAARPGSTLTLSGAGFSPSGNDILFDGTTVVRGAQAPMGSLLFQVPATVAPGKYEVTVRANGALLPGSDVLWVQEAGMPVPKVTSVSPVLIKQGGTVTLKGTGFSRTHNDIVTTFGVVDGGASTDGSTLTFTYKPFDKVEEFRDMDGKKTDVAMDIVLTVVTSGGTSNTVAAKLDM